MRSKEAEEMPEPSKPNDAAFGCVGSVKDAAVRSQGAREWPAFDDSALPGRTGFTFARIVFHCVMK